MAIYSLEWEDRSHSFSPCVLAHSPAFGFAERAFCPVLLAGMEPVGREVWRLHVTPGEGGMLPVSWDPSPKCTLELGSAGM